MTVIPLISKKEMLRSTSQVISDERFIKMSTTYESEQKKLNVRVTILQDFINHAKEKSLNAEHFLSLVRTQRIQIIYNCIGAVELPEKHEKRHSRYSRLCRFFKGTKFLSEVPFKTSLSTIILLFYQIVHTNRPIWTDTHPVCTALAHGLLDVCNIVIHDIIGQHRHDDTCKSAAMNPARTFLFLGDK